MRWIPIIVFMLLATLAACDLFEEARATPEATEAPVEATPSPSPAAPQQSTPSPGVTPPPVTRSITLTLWTSTEIAPNNDVPGGSVLLEQLNTFDNEHASVTLVVELKTIADQGGILSYLRTGRSVAPRILPDVVLLPASQLRTAAGQGLIYPLGDVIQQEAADDLYAVARSLAEVDGQLYGYPFALTNLQHLVYSSSAVTQTVSANWSDLVQEQPGVYLYPAAGATGAELTAQFYRNLGGAFVVENGQPALQSEPLVGALELVRLGATQGFVDPQSATISSADQAWQVFQDSPGRLLHTTANYYLTRRSAESSSNLRVAPLPGPNGALTPTVSAWTWAISTADPERRAVAAELINWLASAENIGAWTLQSYTLPARQSAFDVWPEDAYLSFLRRQIANASAQPVGLNNTVLTAMGEATTAVLLGLSSSADAAAQAQAALAP